MRSPLASPFRTSRSEKHLVKEELGTRIKITSCSDDPVFEHCIKKKLAEMKFTENKRREKELMRLVHSNQCVSQCKRQHLVVTGTSAN